MKKAEFFTVTESFGFLLPDVFLMPEMGKVCFSFFHQNLSNT